MNTRIPGGEAFRYPGATIRFISPKVIEPEFELLGRSNNGTTYLIRVTKKVMDWIFESHIEEVFHSDIVARSDSHLYSGVVSVTGRLYSLIALRWA